MSDKPIMIKDPLVIMFKEPGGRVICRIHPDATSNYRQYGMLVCDLVRHVAKAYDVEEHAVWEWVDKERDNPTTDIVEHS